MDDIEFLLNGLLIQEEDKLSVIQLAKELDRTWNQRDARAFSDLFETNGDFRFHTGAWIRGTASIQAVEKPPFPARGIVWPDSLM